MAVLHELNNRIEHYGLNSWLGAGKAVLLLLCIALTKDCCAIIYNLYFHPLRNIPGPKLWIAFPILRRWSQVRGTSEFQIRDLHAKYGEAMRVSANEVLFISPQAWKDIYGHGHAELPKWYPKGIHMDHRQIISSNAKDHFRFRRAMLPAFSEKALTQQEPLIQVYVELLLKRLHEISETDRWTNMVRWYNFTTFDLIADLAFGESLKGLESGTSNAWLNNIEKIMVIAPMFALIGASQILGAIILLLLGPAMRKTKESHLANVERLARTRLTARKQPDRGDFMDFFLRSRGEAHQMSDDEVVVNSDLIMVAGSETTATLLSGVTFWLLKTPDAYKRVVEEVRGAFGSNEEITFSAARVKLPYMIACLDEALRLFPPVPLSLSRSVPEPGAMEICGYNVPPKTIVGVHHLSAYTSEINFHRAREYLPERWLHDATTNSNSPFYNDRRDIHKPFSFGPRDCIGRNLAYHEMRLIMAKVLYNFDLKLDESCNDWHNQRIFALWEKPPLKVYIKRRVID